MAFNNVVGNASTSNWLVNWLIISAPTSFGSSRLDSRLKSDFEKCVNDKLLVDIIFFCEPSLVCLLSTGGVAPTVITVC